MRDRDDLLAAINDAGADGLDPANYHLASIARAPDAEARDLLLTDAFLLLASHLLSGRVDPESVEPTWCLTPRTNDLVPALETALELHEVRSTIARMPPTHRHYIALRVALADFRRIGAAGGWTPLDAGKSLRIGDRGARIMQLAARLVASGDLSLFVTERLLEHLHQDIGDLRLVDVDRRREWGAVTFPASSRTIPFGASLKPARLLKTKSSRQENLPNCAIVVRVVTHPNVVNCL